MDSTLSIGGQMAAIPGICGVSDLRTRKSEILSKLRDGPVVLTQHARAVGVLVSPGKWNQLIEELENLQDALAALEARQDAEPSVELEQYAATRSRHVPGAAG
jgi:prevent-host-death family protein